MNALWRYLRYCGVYQLMAECLLVSRGAKLRTLSYAVDRKRRSWGKYTYFIPRPGCSGGATDSESGELGASMTYCGEGVGVYRREDCDYVN